MFYESAAEGSGGELRSVVRPDRQPIPGHGPSDHRRVDTSQRLDGSAPHVETPCDEFSGAAIHDGVEVDPAVLGCPDFGHVHMPQLVRPSHPEVSGSATSSQTTRRLQKPMGAHDPLCPLPVNRLTQLARGDGLRPSEFHRSDALWRSPQSPHHPHRAGQDPPQAADVEASCRSPGD